MQNVKKEDIKNSVGSNTVTFCHLVDICLKLQQKVNNTCDRGIIIKAKMTVITASTYQYLTASGHFRPYIAVYEFSFLNPRL